MACYDPSNPLSKEEFDALFENVHEDSNKWDSVIQKYSSEQPDGFLEQAADWFSDSFRVSVEDIQKPNEFIPWMKDTGKHLKINTFYAEYYRDVLKDGRFGSPSRIPFERRYSNIVCNTGNDSLENKILELYEESVSSYLNSVIESDEQGIFAQNTGLTSEQIRAASESKEGRDAAVAALDDQRDRSDKRKEDIKKSLFTDRAIYQEQCFLLSQIIKLVDLKQDTHIPRLPYTESKIFTKVSGSEIDVNANSPILIADQPFGFINRMTQVAHSKKLFNLTTDKISSLVPSIKLYKVETDSKTGKDMGFVEIEFDSNPAIKSYAGERSALDLFKDKRKRGLGVGLKDFSFTFHGSDPFAAKKAIQAKLSIFATSFGDLIQNRVGTYKTISKDSEQTNINSQYKFADLALRTGKTPEDLRTNLSKIQKDNLDKLNFRLKAVLGWAIPQDARFTSEEQDAINDSFVNINLTPTTHDFSFDEMGGVTFTINYLAYIEDYFNNPSFNIFSSSGIELNRVGRKLFYEFLDNQKCDDNTIQQVKEQDAPLIQAEKGISLSRIVRQLSYQNKVLYYNLSYDQISQFLRTGKFAGSPPEPKIDNESDTTAIRQAFKTQLDDSGIKDDKLIQNLQISLTSTSRDRNKISFFYVSDLIDVVMQNIDKSLNEISEKLKDSTKEALNYYQNAGSSTVNLSEEIQTSLNEFIKSSEKSSSVAKETERLLKAKEQFKKLRIVLGPMEIADPFDRSKIRFCSIGDIPISLNYFIEFMTEKMLSKDLAYYPITNFIKDLTSDLIRNFINSDGCFSFNTKQRVRLNSSVISAFARSDKARKEGEDDLTYFIRSNPKTIGKNGIFNVPTAMQKGLKPVLQVAGPSRSPLSLLQPEREFNYYVFYAGRAYPTEFMTGDEEEDAKSGIFHYILGKDRGLVKNITLDKTDQPGLKELRFEQEGYDGLTQLREVYNANIDCFLNPHTFPGTYIYIDPKGFSPEAGINYTQFGIGGYYMITRSEHSIGLGKADTKIVAKWVADSTGMRPEEQNRPDVSEEEDKPKKCAVQKRQSSFAERLEKELVIDSIGDAALLVVATPVGFVANAIVKAAIGGDE